MLPRSSRTHINTPSNFKHRTKCPSMEPAITFVKVVHPILIFHLDIFFSQTAGQDEYPTQSKHGQGSASFIIGHRHLCHGATMPRPLNPSSSWSLVRILDSFLPPSNPQVSIHHGSSIGHRPREQHHHVYRVLVQSCHHRE